MAALGDHDQPARPLLFAQQHGNSAQRVHHLLQAAPDIRQDSDLLFESRVDVVHGIGVDAGAAH